MTYLGVLADEVCPPLLAPAAPWLSERSRAPLWADMLMLIVCEGAVMLRRKDFGWGELAARTKLGAGLDRVDGCLSSGLVSCKRLHDEDGQSRIASRGGGDNRVKRRDYLEGNGLGKMGNAEVRKTEGDGRTKRSAIQCNVYS